MHPHKFATVPHEYCSICSRQHDPRWHDALWREDVWAAAFDARTAGNDAEFDRLRKLVNPDG